MKTYIGTKIVNMKPMGRQEYYDFRGLPLPANENGLDEGYLVEYPDSPNANTKEYAGYVSWTPKDVADRAYSKSGELTFGDAIHFLKKGCKVARKGWNGKSMFLYMVPENSYPASRNTLGTLKGMFKDNLVPYGAYIAMKTAQDNVVPWLASQTDMLSEDWVIV